MTRTEAKRLASRVKARYEKLPDDAGSGMESATWTLALETLIAWARELTSDVKRSRDMIALASFLVGKDKKRERLHRQALESPDLALKCKDCGADQDAHGSTCYDDVPNRSLDGEDCDGCGKCGLCKHAHWDACGSCGVCVDCGTGEWVRPGVDERLTSGGTWERVEKRGTPRGR